MSNLSEEEIIKDILDLAKILDKTCESGRSKESDKIRVFVDLYNKEKNKNRKLDRENQALYESINCDDNTMLARLYQEEKEKNKELFLQYEKEVDKLEYQITTMISKDKIKGKLLEPIREEANKINKKFFEKDKGFEVEGALLQELGAIEGMILELLEEE